MWQTTSAKKMSRLGKNVQQVSWLESLCSDVQSQESFSFFVTSKGSKLIWVFTSFYRLGFDISLPQQTPISSLLLQQATQQRLFVFSKQLTAN
jgi:hypothetical protein